MAESKISCKQFRKIITVTTGTSTYDGFYFGDASNTAVSGWRIVSAQVIDASVTSGASNVFAYAQVLGYGGCRVFSVRQQVTATVVLLYEKA